MFEHPSAEENKEPAVDKKWFERIGSSSFFQAYELLTGDKAFREQQKEKFLAGEIDNPKLDYPKISLEKLDEIESNLRSLKKEIKVSEENQIVRQTYIWRINEKLAEVGLLRVVAAGNMRNFKRYTEFIYGAPSKEIFDHLINRLRQRLSKQTDSTKPGLAEVARELLADMPEAIDVTLGLPEVDVVSVAREQTRAELSDIISAAEVEGELNAQQIKSLFEEALQKLKADGWSVVVTTDSGTAINVSQENREVRIPEKRKVLFQKVQKLIAHELGTHVARRENGVRSKLMLLALGLDRYESGEEGVATMREQVIDVADLKDFAGFENYLAISLVYGYEHLAE